MTPPEIYLWERLRSPPHSEPRFRRQHPVGPYTLDFYCHAARLVVEVDGWIHGMGDQPQRDERRDRWLQGQGLIVLRIPASEVMKDADEVAEGVRREAAELISRRQTSGE